MINRFYRNLLVIVFILIMHSCSNNSCERAIEAYQNDQIVGMEISDPKSFCQGYDSSKKDKNYTYYLLGEKNIELEWFYDSLTTYGCTVKAYGDRFNEKNEQYVSGWNWYQIERMRNDHGEERINTTFLKLM